MIQCYNDLMKCENAGLQECKNARIKQIILQYD